VHTRSVAALRAGRAPEAARSCGRSRVRVVERRAFYDAKLHSRSRKAFV
jgi:hypothetical protein